MRFEKRADNNVRCRCGKRIYPGGKKCSGKEGLLSDTFMTRTNPTIVVILKYILLCTKGIEGQKIAEEIGLSTHSAAPWNHFCGQVAHWAVQKRAKPIGGCGDIRKKKRKGRKRKLSEQYERQIGKRVSNSSSSVIVIEQDLELEVSKTTVWRAIQRNSNIVGDKMAKTLRLLPRHIDARMEFARNNMDRDWKNVIFSDEKKFNLDGTDGFTGYFRDLRKEPRYFSRRNFSGESVMVWAAFTNYGKVGLVFISSRINSAEYAEILRDKLLPWVCFGHRIPFVYQQDNASIRKSRETTAWFNSEGFNFCFG